MGPTCGEEPDGSESFGALTRGSRWSCQERRDLSINTGVCEDACRMVARFVDGGRLWGGASGWTNL